MSLSAVGLASGNVPVEYRVLDGGFRGTDQTVEVMRQLASGVYGSRSPKIRALAINILRAAGVPEKNYPAEMVALHNWVRDNIRYTRDVYGQETLSPPEEVAFNSKAGDCDDKACLLAALLGAVGIATRFKVLGVTKQQFSHVYLQAQIGNRWISLDPIMRQKPAGWEAPKSLRAIEKVYAPNVPNGVTMRRGMNGLGYVGDPRIVSHLEEEPAGEAPGASYVQMESYLDNDAPTAQLSNNPPAFGQNANVAPRQIPWAHSIRPQNVDRRLPPAAVAARVAEEEARFHAAERAANPIHGLNDVMGPEKLAGLGANVMDQQPEAYMQRPPMVVQPDGIDAQFGRKALVTNSGDRILYRGLWAMNEKPPIRPVQGVGGIAPGAAPGRGFGSRMIPGMGYLGGRGMSGPGMGDEMPVEVGPVTKPANPLNKPLVIGAVVLGALLLLRKKK